MRKIIDFIKRKIKSNTLICDLLRAYLVKFDYGYMYSPIEIRNFLKRNKSYCCGPLYDPDKKNVFIFIGDKNIDSTMRKAVFGDIDLGNVRDFDCRFYTTRILKENKWCNLHRLYFKINKFIPLPFKKVWESFYTTSEICADANTNTFVIFLAGAYYEETFSQPKLLKRINSYSKTTFCKKILYMVDPIDKYPLLPEWFPYFDIIASYSHIDEKKYGTVYIDSPCVNMNLNTIEMDKDIYFRAMDSGRGAFVSQCYNVFARKGIVCDFHIQTNEQNCVSYPGLQFDNTRVEYEEMVKEELNANVLLEIVIPGVGSGTTLRYKEAIMYGKKLLTNNPNVRLLELYNPENIKYFENPEDVDIKWLKERITIDYNYMGEFSTDAFCKKIVSLFEV